MAAKREPASIRYKNPGAMWGRTGKRPAGGATVPTNAKIPLKWGSSQTVYLGDGTGQGNNIAVFDTWVQGICAQRPLADVAQVSQQAICRRHRDMVGR